MKKFSMKSLKPLLKSQVLHKLEPTTGWSDFTGVEVKNNSDATIYLLFFSEFDIEP